MSKFTRIGMGMVTGIIAIIVILSSLSTPEIAPAPIAPDLNCPPLPLALGMRHSLGLGERICTTTGRLILENQTKTTVPVTEDFGDWMLALNRYQRPNDPVILMFEEPDSAHPAGKPPTFFQNAAVFYPPKNKWVNFWVLSGMYFQLASVATTDMTKSERLEQAKSLAFTLICAMEECSYEDYQEHASALGLIVNSKEMYNLTVRKVRFIKPPVLWPGTSL